jgi:hypothetical protein
VATPRPAAFPSGQAAFPSAFPSASGHAIATGGAAAGVAASAATGRAAYDKEPDFDWDDTARCAVPRYIDGIVPHMAQFRTVKRVGDRLKDASGEPLDFLHYAQQPYSLEYHSIVAHLNDPEMQTQYIQSTKTELLKYMQKPDNVPLPTRGDAQDMALLPLINDAYWCNRNAACMLRYSFYIITDGGALGDGLGFGFFRGSVQLEQPPRVVDVGYAQLVGVEG